MVVILHLTFALSCLHLTFVSFSLLLLISLGKTDESIFAKSASF